MVTWQERYEGPLAFEVIIKEGFSIGVKDMFGEKPDLAEATSDNTELIS